MAAPNQNIATIVREKPSLNNYTKVNNDSIAAAMKALTPMEFQVWLYLAKNKDGIEWEISPAAACEEWGIKVSSFHKAITTLKKLGYLVPKGDSKTKYWFYEKAKEETTKFTVERVSAEESTSSSFNF